MKKTFLHSAAKKFLILSSLVPYFYLTQWAGVFSVLIIGIAAITFKILGMIHCPYKSESLVIFIAIILLLRCVFDQNHIRIILLGFILCMLVFLLMNRKHIPPSIKSICDSKALTDSCFAAISLSTPFVFYSNKFPNSQFSWMLIGDGNNWFTQLRVIQSISGSRFRELLANSPATSVLTDLFNPVRAKTPSFAMVSDLNAMLNFQLLTTIFIVMIFMNRVNKFRSINFSMRILLIFFLTQFGSVLGMAGLNGFISSSLTVLSLLLLLSFSEMNFSNNRFYEVLLYLSMTVLLLFTWSLLIPFVIAQYMFVRVRKATIKENKIAFILMGALLTFFSLYLGVQVVKKIDVVGYLTIPRGGVWPDFNVNLYVGILLLLFALLHQVGIFSELYFLHLWTLLVVCQLLFLGYENPRFWAPWTSYYPQKLFTLVYLALVLWFISKLLGQIKGPLFSFALVFALSCNFFLQLPNPILQKTANLMNLISVSKLDQQGPMAISFILDKIDERRPFAFWNFFDWPVESSANAWAGLAWEQYPGNWSLQKDNLVFNTNYSGPVGNRNYHNGNQSDTANLCRLVELLPIDGVIYTKDSVQVVEALKKCDIQKSISVKSS